MTKPLAGMVVSRRKRPPPHPVYGDSYQRGFDPLHENAFLQQFKVQAPNRGERKAGWFLLDNWGKQVAFIPDGTVIND